MFSASKVNSSKPLKRRNIVMHPDDLGIAIFAVAIIVLMVIGII